jgi:predicted dehydrogenase
MIEAARKYDRVVAVGTQRRSSESYRAAAEFVRSGKLGKVPYIRAMIGGNRPNIGRKPDGTVPAGVDYNLWLGPAAERPFNPNRFHYEWHWFWDYGTGELGNNGVHALDAARLIVPGLDEPTRITSTGGKFVLDDDREAPDTQIATFDFPGTTLVWEHRMWSKDTPYHRNGWITLFGENGTLVFDGEAWSVRDIKDAAHKAVPYEEPHLRNFLECVKSRQRPNADIEQGHLSTRLCHLGNIAFRVGRSIQFDAATESIPGDAAASALLGRSYRKPFVVPEKV